MFPPSLSLSLSLSLSRMQIHALFSGRLAHWRVQDPRSKRNEPRLFHDTSMLCFYGFDVAPIVRSKRGRRADNVVIRLSFVRLGRHRVGDMVVTDKLNRLIAHDASIECDWRAPSRLVSSSENCCRSLKSKSVRFPVHRAPPKWSTRWTRRRP